MCGVIYNIEGEWGELRIYNMYWTGHFANKCESSTENSRQSAE